MLFFWSKVDLIPFCGQMVEQALQALTLHIMWKTRGLTAAEDPSPDEAKHQQNLVEQRESLLEKLVEYAIGGRSNAVEGVKRSVCIVHSKDCPSFNGIVRHLRIC